jgi:hypothetical protein
MKMQQMTTKIDGIVCVAFTDTIIFEGKIKNLSVIKMLLAMLLVVLKIFLNA